jgi:hypothetical protein
MKPLHGAIVLALICVSVAAQAQASYDVTFNLYLHNTTQTYASVLPGETAHLWVSMVTGATASVVQVNYRVLLETEGWQLTSRNMDTHGWYEDDGLWDNSVPTVSGCPATITNALFAPPACPDPTLTDPDFYTDTIREGFKGMTQTWPVEDFQLTIPAGTPVGDYTIALVDPGAGGSGGQQLTCGVGDPFELAVTPEPCSLALLVMGVAGGLVARRRKS